MTDYWKYIKAVLLFILVTLAATVLTYLVFALLFDTDIEKKLLRENRMYADLMPRIQAEEERRADAVAYLQHRDNTIYNLVFHSGAPDLASVSDVPSDFDADTVSFEILSSKIAGKRENTVAVADRVDSLMRDVCLLLAATSSPALPPMALPARGITYPQVGAGTGKRMSPFLKAVVQHNGLDLVLEPGDTVYANASGIAAVLKDTPRAQGLVLELNHGNGYVTRMEHLESILVKSGDPVAAGQAVATAGMTGNSFAPHLHYVIRGNGKYLDPVDYLFASVSPQEYVNMLYMSSKTIQSLD